MHVHSVNQRFCGYCCHPFDVRHDCLPPVEIFPRNVDKLLFDVQQLRPFRSLCDGGEKLVDLVLIHHPKLSVVCCPEDWIRYVLPEDLDYSLHDTLFDSDGREEEDFLTICFVLRVTIRVDLWFNGAIFDSGSFGG